MERGSYDVSDTDVDSTDSTGEPPLVSIGLPVHDGGEFLDAALQSLQQQTFRDFEVIISDNASSDATPEICRRFVESDPRFVYVRNEENLGAARNFNRTFERARGKYFKWFAHDDRLAPEHLERCVAVLEQAPASVVLAFPAVRYIDWGGRVVDDSRSLEIKQARRPESYDGISFGRLLRLPPAVYPIFAFGLMRREALARTRLIGPWIMSDMTLVGELRLLGDFREIKEELFFQRVYRRDRSARGSLQGEAAWFDPARAARALHFPYARLALEYVRAIRALVPGAGARLACYGALPGFLAVAVGRVLRRRVWRTWSWVSVQMVRAARFTTLPLRLWCLMAGLRRRDGRLLRLSVKSPWGRAPLALLSFAAGRLGRRFDPLSMALLTDWLMGDDPDRRVVAALEASRAPNRYRAFAEAEREDSDQFDGHLDVAVQEARKTPEALDRSQLDRLVSVADEAAPSAR